MLEVINYLINVLPLNCKYSGFLAAPVEFLLYQVRSYPSLTVVETILSAISRCVYIIDSNYHFSTIVPSA